MTVKIISDKIYNRRIRYNFSEGYYGDVVLQDWAKNGAVNSSTEAVVLDLDLNERTNQGSQTVPVLASEVNAVRTTLNEISQKVIRYIEHGNVVIGLLGPQYTTGGFNQLTTHDWLDMLHATTINDHMKLREKIQVISDVPGVQSYFECVGGYQFGIKLQENVQTEPEMLAQHSLDNEVVAVAFDEYRNTDGVNQTASGYVVLLPQPTDIDAKYYDVIRSLEEMGNHFIKREKLGELVDEGGAVDLDHVLENGESEVVELKEELPKNKKLRKEAVALANCRGGVIIIGISDNLDLIGVEDIHSVEERIADILRDSIEPTLRPQISIQKYGNTNVLVIEVPKARQNPYSLNGTYYVRVGTTTKKLTGSELQRWISSR